MGYSRKEEIERLRREKRTAKASKKRKEGVRHELVRFLIVCEGEKTEPFYFKSLIDSHVSTVREVTVKGEGMGTVALIGKTLEEKEMLERMNAMRFDQVWAVFDKDDFDDFNEAIRKAEEKGIRCAWSNEAFELWYCLHFEHLTSGISRVDYISKIQEHIRKKSGESDFRYGKGNKGIYSLLQQYGNEVLAKKNAKRLRELHSGTNYSKHNPCTMVDLLVDELEKYC